MKILSLIFICFMLCGCRTEIKLPRESYKERYMVYHRCYDVTNDYEKALACVEIHKYLQGE